MKIGKITPQANTNLQYDTWVKVDEHSGSEVTSVAFSVEDTNNEEYRITSYIHNDCGSNAYYKLLLNNSEDTNYAQRLYGTNTTIGANQETDETGVLIGVAQDGLVTWGEGIISTVPGIGRMYNTLFMANVNSATVGSIYRYGCLWGDTSTKITSINVVSNQADGISADSVITLYKKVTR